MKSKVMIMLIIISFLILLMTGCAQPNDPESPEENVYLELQAVYETEGYVMDVEIGEHYLYVAEDEGGFSIFDTSTDTLCSRVRGHDDGEFFYSFSNIKLISVDETSNALLVYNKYGTQLGIHIFDIRDRSNPVWKFIHTGNLSDISDLKTTSIDSTQFQFYWFYSGSKYYSGRFYDMNGNWQIIGETDEDFSFDVNQFDEHFDTGLIYCASKQLGMKVVNKVDFSTLGTISTTGQTISVKVVDNIAYLGNREEGINVVDISDLNNPVELFSYDTWGLASDIAVNSELNVFALASTSGGVYLFNGPEGEIRRLQCIDDSEIGYTYLVRIQGNLLYVGTRYGVYKYAIINL